MRVFVEQHLNMLKHLKSIGAFEPI
jgi:hypothetical protein